MTLAPLGLKLRLDSQGERDAHAGKIQGLHGAEHRTTLEAANPRLRELAAKFGFMEGIAPVSVATDGTVSAAVTDGSAGSSLAPSMLRLHLTFEGDRDKPPKVVVKRMPSARSPRLK